MEIFALIGKKENGLLLKTFHFFEGGLKWQRRIYLVTFSLLPAGTKTQRTHVKWSSCDIPVQKNKVMFLCPPGMLSCCWQDGDICIDWQEGKGSSALLGKEKENNLILKSVLILHFY